MTDIAAIEAAEARLAALREQQTSFLFRRTHLNFRELQDLNRQIADEEYLIGCLRGGVGFGPSRGA